MGKRVMMTENLFNAIKILLRGGASADEAAEYMGVGTTTIHRVKHADDFADYKQRVRLEAIAMKKREEEKQQALKPKNEPVPEQTPEPAKESKDKNPTYVVGSIYQVNRLIEEMTKQNEHLKFISAKLAFIVEKLT